MIRRTLVAPKELNIEVYKKFKPMQRPTFGYNSNGAVSLYKEGFMPAYTVGELGEIIIAKNYPFPLRIDGGKWSNPVTFTMYGFVTEAEARARLLLEFNTNAFIGLKR